jgi:hypothetical protein
MFIGRAIIVLDHSKVNIYQTKVTYDLPKVINNRTKVIFDQAKVIIYRTKVTYDLHKVISKIELHKKKGDIREG